MSQALLLPRLHPYQWRIANDSAKRKVWVSGRRSGKTVLGGALEIAIANAGGHVAWVAPETKNTRPMWRWVIQVCAPFEKAGVQISHSEKVVTFPSGGFLGVYSADKEHHNSIRSEAFHLVIVDEAAKVSEEAIQESIEPTLADYDGTLLEIGTPKGKNRFFTQYNFANNDASGYSKAWRTPSTINPHPNIRKAVAIAAERVKEGRLTERSYKQEWLAEFVEGGAFFQNVRECGIIDVSIPEAHENHKIVIGGDFAQVEDYTVLSAICTRCREQVDLERFNGLSWAIQIERIVTLCKKWGKKDAPAAMLPERNSIGSPLIEQLQTAGITILPGPDGQPGFQTTAQTKQTLVKMLYASLAGRMIKILKNEIQLNELEAFEEKPTAYGATYSAPAGMHDDTVIALALSNYAMDNPTWWMA